ncbi:MAG: nitroreductase family protein [Candidatus Omnitrophica bacterium]|nr:nitroreductase family protein [Candidatus Omnitrophota bacterium]
MDLIKAIKTRRSIREFSFRRLSKKHLELLVDSARFAPTARNIQPWQFIVITKKDTLKRLSEFADNARFLKDACACIVVFCKETKYYLEDGSSATQNILLTATSLGIGSCWIAGDKKPYAEEVKRLLGVPADYRLVSLVALGYPKKGKRAFYVAEKKDLKEIIHWERF